MSTGKFSARGFQHHPDAKVNGSSDCSRIIAAFPKLYPNKCQRFELAARYTTVTPSLTTMAFMLYPNRQPALCLPHTNTYLLLLALAFLPVIKLCHLLL